MAQPDIAVWAEEVKKSGMLRDRGKGDKDWLHLGAPDSSILELRLGCSYTRVVWSELNPPERPFAYWRLVSAEHPLFPKNEFILGVKFDTLPPPEYCTAQEAREHVLNASPALRETLASLGEPPTVSLNPE
jgi:hypothetical protein